MKKINTKDAKWISVRGWLRYLREVDRTERKKQKQNKNCRIRFANDTVPVQDQVVNFIEKISSINEYDSSV
ncbi:hypothetical protein ACQ1ZM_15650, partial [Enterococcus faecalis]|uniref:hypothetical protein n=1 Tax=Enterococcus faecalis TaxID=1351 RepID=UPI003D6B9C83